MNGQNQVNRESSIERDARDFFETIGLGNSELRAKELAAGDLVDARDEGREHGYVMRLSNGARPAPVEE